MNIIYLHSHDTGRYIQPYGYPVRTPHLQRFAEQGVLFRQAFCAAPTCSPSRAALVTGTWPHVNGMIALAHGGGKLHDYKQHLIHTLKPHGYHAALCGVQHIAGRDPDAAMVATEVIGYDEFLGHGSGEERAEAAAAFIARPHDRPFFLSVGFQETHRTNKSGESVQWHNRDASPMGDGRYCRPPAPVPDTSATRQDFADYAVCVNRLDQYMGQVIQAVDDAGLADSTLIIVTTDHGIAFPGMKCNLTDHGLGVMLMLRGPGFTGGQVIDAMVSHVDVFPTVCDLLDIDRPAWLVGQSMRPLATGDAASIRDELFGEVSYHAAYEPMRAVRTARYKYIRRWPDPAKQRPGRPMANCDDSVSKSHWLEHGWADLPPDMEQLYDLVFDPNEVHDLIDDPRHADAAADMRQRLDRWMRETDDPLLSGRVAPPSGRRPNDPDRLSPRSKQNLQAIQAAGAAG